MPFILLYVKTFLTSVLNLGQVLKKDKALIEPKSPGQNAFHKKVARAKLKSYSREKILNY